MEFKEYRGKTVNDAITEASISLGITSDMLEYEVIEEGSAGILRLFSKDAVIRARKKEEKNQEVEEKIDIKPDFKAELRGINKESKPEAKKQPKFENKKEKKPEVKKEIKPEAASVKKEEKTFAKPEKKKEDKHAEEHDEIKANVQEKPAEIKKESIIITGEAAENKNVNAVLNAIFEKLDVKAEITTTVDETEKVVSIVIDGEDTGDLIGKRGQTLDAIQYLCSIIVNKDEKDYYRVKVDTNNYRERRQKTLENLAKNIASKVKKTRKKVALEPMNPYERRVIHSYLQSDKYVTTKSEGEEPNRRVVIYYKKS